MDHTLLQKYRIYSSKKLLPDVDFGRSWTTVLLAKLCSQHTFSLLLNDVVVQWVMLSGNFFLHQTCLNWVSLHFSNHFPGGPGLAGTRMSPFWMLLERRMMEMAVTAGAIRRAMLQSPWTNWHPVFLQAGCPFCRPTNGVKALKEYATEGICYWLDYEKLTFDKTFSLCVSCTGHVRDWATDWSFIRWYIHTCHGWSANRLLQVWIIIIIINLT